MRAIFFLTFCLLSFFATLSSVGANPEQTEPTPDTTELKTKDSNKIPQVFYGTIRKNVPVVMARVRTTLDDAANLEDGAVAAVNAVLLEGGATAITAAVWRIIMDATERDVAPMDGPAAEGELVVSLDGVVSTFSDGRGAPCSNNRLV
ncbi:hypothetical protein CTheo_5651 [Ceratobasidium theobromae]|uniref:Effector protein n=1 Tax=Ceratobasidium theobromae TaxID=1582974 RepID=A0A5N5QGZ6_9AGAM|nr:hypothetical protein CTheo_5651 [Ceratobasidium theobromae]